MNIEEDRGLVTLTAYRFCSDTYKGEWLVALEPSEADEALVRMNEEGKGEWTLETHPMGMWIRDARRLGAALAGKKTSLEKKASSRENGKLGGRPKGSKNRPKPNG